MMNPTQARLKTFTPEQLIRLAGWSAYASGSVSVMGILFIIGMLAFPDPFGKLNDICVLIQYALALPLTVALHWLLKDRAPALSRAAMWVGISGMVAIAILQYLLVADIISFTDQVGMVVFAMFVVLGVWFAITGHLGRATGRLTHSLRMSFLAWTYLGYPFWAFWIGRQLLKERRL